MKETPDELMNRLSKRVKVDNAGTWENYDGNDRVISSYEAWDQVKESVKNRVYLKTGIPKLDEMTGGFVAGEVIVITGTTSHGKTLFAQSLTHTFASTYQKPCLWFSFEVGKEGLLEIFVNMETDKGDPILFYMPNENEELSVNWINDKITESMEKKFDPKVVFIDHLDYIVPFIHEANKADVIGDVMRRLKKIAIKHKIIVVMIAHTTKIKGNTEPDLSNIRSSSYVAQEADTALWVQRVFKLDVDYKENNTTNVYILKNRRKGNLGMIPMHYASGKLHEIDNSEQVV